METTNQNTQEPKEQTSEKNEKTFQKPIYEQPDFTPKKVDVQKMLQDGLGNNDDPGKFMEGLTGAGLAAGQIVSLLLNMGGDKKPSFRRHKVVELGKDGVTVEGKDQEGKYHEEIPYAKITVIEIFGKGQKFASDELHYPFMGKKPEEMAAHLGKLLAGKEIYLTQIVIKDKANPDQKITSDAKVSLDRGEKGRISAKINPVANELTIPDKILNIQMDELKKQELMAKGELFVKFDFTNKEKVRVVTDGKIFIDKQLKKVRYKYLDQKQMEAETKKQEAKAEQKQSKPAEGEKQSENTEKQSTRVRI